ncbi:MAG: ATP-binding protein [Candidatus Saccharimonadales bacterium]
MAGIRNYTYQTFIQPKSQGVDDRRRELILNILLFGLTVIAIADFITTTSHHLTGQTHNTNSFWLTTAFLGFMIGLLYVSRRGYYKVAAYILIFCLGLVATFMMLELSFELPIAELTFVLIIVMGGILFSARTGLLITGLVSLLVFLVGYAQIYHMLHPSTGWFNQPLELVDVIGYVAIFSGVGLVSWLANREIDRSLSRARTSEAALEIERDSLEIKVVERTRELEQAQLVRVMELQRFAEFGRLSAGLLHEVANPLTAASLNLEQLGNQHRPALVRRAMQSLQHIERYVEAARKQLKLRGNLVSFSIQKEIKQVLNILKYRARESSVKIELLISGRHTLFGDPVKFNQLIANLLLNAIEAYDNMPEATAKRPIVVRVQQQNQWLKVTVRDWGRGLSVEERERIFEPFYSTKSKVEQNMGIGLAMVWQIATTDFRGRITVTSSKQRGTCFTVYLRSQDKIASQ